MHMGVVGLTTWAWATYKGLTHEENCQLPVAPQLGRLDLVGPSPPPCWDIDRCVGLI